MPAMQYGKRTTKTMINLADLNHPMPWSEEAEKAVLSCLLNFPARMEDAPPIAAFYHSGHRTILSALSSMLIANDPIDSVTVTHFLRDRGQLDEVGGAYEITTLFGDVGPIQRHFGHYAKIIATKYSLRRMIEALAAGISALQAFPDDSEESATGIIETVLRGVSEAANDDGTPDIPFRPIRQILDAVVEQVQTRLANPGCCAGVSTGFETLDQITGGMQEGRLTVIAAESSDGKSCLARQCVESACMGGNVGVIYTYEMMDTEEARRMLCSQGTINSGNLKNGRMTRAEQDSLARQMRDIGKWDISIVDVAGRTIEQICRDIARRSKKLNDGQRLIASIDYIQLCKTSATSKSREREVAHITSTAKQCAKMTRAHIIMPSQVNQLGDVRESMAIEQDADNLWKIEKHKTKAKGKKGSKWDDDEGEPTPRRDVHVFKNRDGERFRKMAVNLVGQFFRFEAIDTSDPIDMM